MADPARAPRLVAYRLVRAVEADGAYANLALPPLIAEAGLTGRDAALATELGYGTVRGHVRGVLEKLGAHSRLQAVAEARKAGLINS